MADPAADDVGANVWRKSSRSPNEQNCVEVPRVRHHVAVRDSKSPASGPLIFDLDAWAAFTSAVKSGALDR